MGSRIGNNEMTRWTKSQSKGGTEKKEEEEEVEKLRYPCRDELHIEEDVKSIVKNPLLIALQI